MGQCHCASPLGIESDRLPSTTTWAAAAVLSFCSIDPCLPREGLNPNFIQAGEYTPRPDQPLTRWISHLTEVRDLTFPEQRSELMEVG